MKTSIAGAVGVVALSLVVGCTVTADPAKIGPFPTDYKATIKATILKQFFDPYSMRSVSISYPETGYLFFQQGWIVCVEANAKNRMGGYVGLRQTAYLIHEDAVAQEMEDAPLCAKVSYQPWPEMENGGSSAR
jgi:hypothetical protein